MVTTPDGFESAGFEFPELEKGARYTENQGENDKGTDHRPAVPTGQPAPEPRDRPALAPYGRDINPGAPEKNRLRRLGGFLLATVAAWLLTKGMEAADRHVDFDGTIKPQISVTVTIV